MDAVLRQALYEGRAGREIPTKESTLSNDALFYIKLWENPCWFSFRVNYLALHFNNPVYGFIQSKLGLLRPDFVVLWSLYLGGSATLTDVVRSSGFPKNTLSRASNKCLRLGFIDRHPDPLDQRSALLDLTASGRVAVEGAKAVMIEHERTMLECLSPAERLNLSEILTKLVTASGEWPQMLEDHQADEDP